MTRRSQEDWRQLVAEQQASELNATDFCRERKINPKYFSLRKQRLKQSKAPAFIQAKVTTASSSQSSLHYQGLELTLNDCSPAWVAQLLRELCA